MGSVAGAGIGVAIGYYLFKQNTVLPLMAFGIGGAIASGYVANAMTPKPKPVVKKVIKEELLNMGWTESVVDTALGLVELKKEQE